MGLSLGKLKRCTVRLLLCLASDLKSLFGVSFLLGVLLATVWHNYKVKRRIIEKRGSCLGRSVTVGTGTYL